MSDAVQTLLPEWLVRSEVYYVVVTDLEGRYIFTNALFKNRFSFLNHNFIGQPFASTIHPDDVARCNQAAYTCITQPGRNVRVDVRKPDTGPDDYYRTCWDFSLLSDAENRPVGICCVGHDITETERISRLAKNLATKVEAIMDEVPEGLLVISHDWRIVRANQAAGQILGKTAETLVNTLLWDLYADVPSYNYSSMLRNAMEQHRTVAFEDFDDKANRWYSVVAYPSPEGLTVFFRDTTNEKQAVQQLADSEAKLRAILDTTSDAYTLLDASGKIISQNRKARQNLTWLWGHEPHLGDDMHTFVPPSSRDSFKKHFETALAGERVSVEREVNLGTEKRWFSLQYERVDNISGHPLGVALTISDIDIRKRVEERLRDSEAKLRAILDNTTDVYVLVSPDYRILSINKAARQIGQMVLKHTVSEGDVMREWIPAAYHATFEANFKRALAGEQIRIERLFNFGPTSRWLALCYYQVLDADGQVIGVAISATDIDERKRMEDQLRQSESMLSAIYNSSDESTAFVDPNLRIVYFNRTGEESALRNFGRELKAGELVTNYVIPELREQFIEMLQRALAGQVLRGEFQSGDLWYRVSVFPVYDERQQIVGLSCNALDITDRKRNELLIAAQNQRLREIAFVQSHGLRRPIANLLGICQLMSLEKEAGNTAGLLNWVEELNQAARETDEMIKQIVNKANEIE